MRFPSVQAAPDPEPPTSPGSSLEFHPYRAPEREQPSRHASLLGAFVPQDELLAVPTASHRSVTMRAVMPDNRSIWPLVLTLVLSMLAGAIWISLGLQLWQ